MLHPLRVIADGLQGSGRHFPTGPLRCQLLLNMTGISFPVPVQIADIIPVFEVVGSGFFRLIFVARKGFRG